jgi:hypothetical protein
MNYQEFLKNKIDIALDTGFDISLDEINSVLLPHQKDAVKWAITDRAGAGTRTGPQEEEEDGVVCY